MRFVSPEPNTGCWLWEGGTSSGYGAFRVGSLTDGTRRNEGAHRFSCVMSGRSIPDGMQVLHKCDNKICVNPDHLYVGTPSQNGKDAWARGQQKPRPMHGEDNSNAKLTRADVIAIRSSADRNVRLAERYAVSAAHIGGVKRGECW